MVSLFHENIIFIFFFSIIAIYNYSDLREYQRLTIIYISVYALMFLNLIGIRRAILFLTVALFCFLEVLTSDEEKLKILVNPFYKVADFLYLSFSQYAFGGVCLSLLLLKPGLPNPLSGTHLIFTALSLCCLVFSLTAVLRQKYVVHTFRQMYRIFTEFPIQTVQFNSKLAEACAILTSLEDRLYWERDAYTFLSPRYIVRVLKDKTASRQKGEKVACICSTGRRFIKNIFNESRGYSTLPMQLIRSLGIKRGYNCKYRRKVFEILYAGMFFRGVKRRMKEDKVSKRKHFKEYLLYLYFHQVNTFLGDATFSKFLNAFDMKYGEKNKMDIYDCTNEGIFIACMGLSKKAIFITRENVEYYLGQIDGVQLNPNVVCEMVDQMMDKPYDGNYLQ